MWGQNFVLITRYMMEFPPPPNDSLEHLISFEMVAANLKAEIRLSAAPY